MKHLWKIIGIYAAFLAQSLIFENINIFSCSPDILLTALIICCVWLDFPAASAIGAFAGVLTDTMYGSVFGAKTLLYMYLAIIVSFAVDKKNGNSPLIMGWICFVSVAAKEIVIAVLKMVFGYPLSIGYLASNIFVKGIFAAVFALVFVLLQQYIRNHKSACDNSVKEETV